MTPPSTTLAKEPQECSPSPLEATIARSTNYFSFHVSSVFFYHLRSTFTFRRLTESPRRLLEGRCWPPAARHRGVPSSVPTLSSPRSVPTPARSVNTHQRPAVVVSRRIRHRRRRHASSHDLINGLTRAALTGL